MEKIVQNNLEQLQKIMINPQEAIKAFQDNNKALVDNLQKVASEIPVKTQSYIAKQQAEVNSLNEELSKAFTKSPVNWENVGKIWFDYQTNQVTSYLNEVKKQNDEFQKIVSDLNKNDKK